MLVFGFVVLLVCLWLSLAVGYIGVFKLGCLVLWSLYDLCLRLLQLCLSLGGVVFEVGWLVGVLVGLLGGFIGWCV